MMERTVVVCLLVLCMSCIGRAQQQSEPTPTSATAATPPSAQTEVRVPLTEQPVALDATGAPALAARLRTTQLNGTSDAPLRNIRVVVENRGQTFYSYVSGWLTFYDGDGVRCGEGLFKVDALAPNESAETDAPGLRLTCSPSSWRITANNLLTRTADATKPSAPIAPTQNATTNAATPLKTNVPPLSININGEEMPLQPGNPIEVKIGAEKVRIVVNPASAVKTAP